jgi:hypothetical protein
MRRIFAISAILFALPAHAVQIELQCSETTMGGAPARSITFIDTDRKYARFVQPLMSTMEFKDGAFANVTTGGAMVAMLGKQKPVRQFFIFENNIVRFGAHFDDGTTMTYAINLTTLRRTYRFPGKAPENDRCVALD